MYNLINGAAQTGPAPDAGSEPASGEPAEMSVADVFIFPLNANWSIRVTPSGISRLVSFSQPCTMLLAICVSEPASGEPAEMSVADVFIFSYAGAEAESGFCIDGVGDPAYRLRFPSGYRGKPHYPD